MQKVFDYLNIFIIIAIIAISPWFYGSVGLPQKYFIHLASLAMLVLWLLKKNISSREVSFYPPYLPLFCFLVLSIISITFSIYRYASILDTLNLLTYIIIFFMVMETINNKKRASLLICFVSITGLFYCVYGLLQYRGYLPNDFWAESTSLSSHFVNSGSFGAFVNINIFLSLGMALYYKRIILRIICLLFFALFFISLILSKSRISWLAFAFIIVHFAFLSFKKPTRLNVMGYIFIATLVIITAYILLRYKALLWERIYVMVPTQFQSVHQRFDVWWGTMRITSTHPFGTGIGTFQYIYPSYRIHSDRFLVDYAHSDYLQIASELGIVGLAAFVWFMTRLLRQVFRVLFRLPNQNFFITVGLICAVLSFTFQALVDFPLQIPANAILFFIIMPLLVRYISFDKLKVVSLNKYANTVIIITIIICVVLFTNIYLSNKYYRLAKKNASRMDWQEAISNYNKSIKLMPINADSYAGRGGLYALKATLAFGQQKTQYHNRALADFIKAGQLNPYEANYHLNLAWLYLDEKNEDNAISEFKKAIKTNPTDGKYYYQYGDYCLQHNRLDEALKTYKKSLTLFIRDDGEFPRLYGDVYGYGLFEKIYRYTQDYQQLKLAVPEDKLDIRLVFAHFFELKKRIAEAKQEYEKILSEYPDNELVKKAIERIKGIK